MKSTFEKMGGTYTLGAGGNGKRCAAQRLLPTERGGTQWKEAEPLHHFQRSEEHTLNSSHNNQSRMPSSA